MPWKFCLALVVALVLGVPAAGPLSSLNAMLWAIAYSAALLLAQVVFLGVLPRRFALPTQIFFAMAAGLLVGGCAALLGVSPFVSDYLGVFGALFLLLLKLVIIPLIFVSVLCGVASVGDAKALGSLGVRTIVYFCSTTCLAVLLGMALVQVLQPGAGRESLQQVAAEQRASQTISAATPINLGQRLQKQILPAIIQNPIMAGQNPIVVIFMALVLGAALASIGDRGAPALAAFRAIDDAFVQVVQWIMLLAPLGVFALLAEVIAELGVDYIVTLGKYCATVLGGLVLHFAVLTCVLVPLLARMRAGVFLRAMMPAFQVSFSTSSSSATLPVTRRCAIERAGADPAIANFVLPIGATINMDGTALYVSVASIFIAQVYGIPLDFQQQAMIFLTAVLVSVGTAGIPGASVGLITLILDSAGIPAEGLALVVGVDRLLDMSRTVVNMTGDASGAVILSRMEGKLNPPPSLSATA